MVHAKSANLLLIFIQTATNTIVEEFRKPFGRQGDKAYWKFDKESEEASEEKIGKSYGKEFCEQYRIIGIK